MNGFLESPTVVQFVISPIVLSILAGVTWMIKRSLSVIQEKQVEAARLQRESEIRQKKVADAVDWLKGLQAGSATSIEAVRANVVNSHSTNLRNDVDSLAETAKQTQEAMREVVTLVQQHARADEELAVAISEIKSAIDALSFTQRGMGDQLGRVERRLDAHIDRGER